VGLKQRRQAPLPRLADRAFLRQQRPGAELEGDRPQLGVVDPILPLLQPPDAPRHDDRGLAEPHFAHRLAQREHARIRILGPCRVFAVGKSVMPAGEPGVLIDHAAQQLGGLVIGPPPQRVERAGRGDDRVVIDAEPRGDLGQPVRHPGAAGDAVDQPPRLLQRAGDDALGAAHLPQDVGMDAAPAAGELISAPCLRHRAPDRVGDQLLVPLAPCAAVIELRDDAPLRIIAVGVDGAERADPAGRRPMAGRDSVGDGDAFAAFDQRQDVDAGHADGVDRFHVVRLAAPNPRVER
jgi:hypothetical protein